MTMFTHFFRERLRVTGGVPMKMQCLAIFIALSLCCSTSSVYAHGAAHTQSNTAHTQSNTAHYLGNEAVLVSTPKHKILFDPFFHNNHGLYQLVPDDIRQSIFEGKSPFDEVALVFISHAHGDHFDAQDTLTYLQRFDLVQLIAPRQAVDLLKGLNGFQNIAKRVHSVELALGDNPWILKLQDIVIDAVRIPHAGWPGRADIENIVFRVSLGLDTTVMHLGDADPKVSHYLPYRSHWQGIETNMAFPPYWFFHSAEGRDILDTYLNTHAQIGVHVPIKIPKLLIQIGRDYFSVPGETRNF
jgi:hypothetical protein